MKKALRRIKLQSNYWPTESGSCNKEVSWLTVSGEWLEQAGFKAGQQVAIKIERNQLITTSGTPHGNH